jgi:hypothetical protein
LGAHELCSPASGPASHRPAVHGLRETRNVKHRRNSVPPEGETRPGETSDTSRNKLPPACPSPIPRRRSLLPPIVRGPPPRPASRHNPRPPAVGCPSPASERQRPAAREGPLVPGAASGDTDAQAALTANAHGAATRAVQRCRSPPDMSAHFLSGQEDRLIRARRSTRREG